MSLVTIVFLAVLVLLAILFGGSMIGPSTSWSR